ncbi:HAMP domain-containing protein [Candidatus Sumerlaeota bacterium]|nr:HAMP domain-containing protein [Candidatus Sumerlaeota bacterium]
MKIRERIMIACGGLLILLLLLAGVALSLLSEFSRSLNQATQDNTRVIMTAASLFTEIPRVGSLSFFSTEQERLNSADLEKSIEVVHANLALLVASLRIAKTSPEVVELQQQWSNYAEDARASFIMPEGPEKNAHWETTVMPGAARVRLALREVMRLNMVESDRAIDSLQSRLEQGEIILMLLAALGIVLAAGFLWALGRLFVQPTRDLVDAINAYEDAPLQRSLGARPRTDELGAVAGALDRMMDRVRETRQGHARMVKRLERRSEIAMDSLPDAILLLDRQGRISYLNEMARKMIDGSPGAATAGIPWPAIRRMVEHVVETRKPEVRHELDKSLQIFVDGVEKFYQPGVFPVFGEQANDLEEIVVLLNDVSYLRQLDEMKTDLVATVSHQLKTPLTSVRMSLHMLRSNGGNLSPTDMELLSTAIDESERLHDTIQSLLDMARIQAGAIEMQMQAVETSSWIRENVEGFRGLLTEKQIKMTTEIPSSLPALRLDGPRMGAVIENIMTNCAKYCRAGDSLHIRAKQDRTDPTTVIMAFSDTGPGISRHDITRIFEKFFRGGTRETVGAGLGLAIARRIVNAHGGEMTCHSVEGEGSTFTIVLHSKTEGDSGGRLRGMKE